VITLLTGETVDPAEVYFNPGNYSFVYRGKDITQLIRNADKRTFEGFDNEFYNNLLYVQKYQREHGGALPATVGSDSVWYNFVQQILTDPLQAPLESLDSTVKELFSSPGIYLVIGAAIFIVIISRR